MSQPRRSLGPVIAYMLTLLGLLLGGIWLWDALRRTPAPLDGHAAQVAPPPVVRTPPAREVLSEAERRQLDEILRKSAGQR